MDILVIVLRLLHIVAGIIWVGFGMVGAWVVHPAAEKLGEKGDTLLRVFYGYSNYNRVFPIVAVLTTLAGLILWGLQAEGARLVDFTLRGSNVMAIGALFGILAFGHGAGATGRFSDKFAQLAREVEEGDASKAGELAEARKKVFTHANISAILTVIAAVAMASARYL